MGGRTHPFLRTIGHTIRGLRLERGLSQEALADRADLDRSYMSGIERGLRNISVLNIARIADALEVSVRDLIGQDVDVQSTQDKLVTIFEHGSEPVSVATPPSAEWSRGCSLSLG